MSISSWAHAQLKSHGDGILVMSLLSSIITTVVFMDSLLNYKIDNWHNLIILILLIINTLITIILASISRGYKKQMKTQCDSHVKEIVELLNLCRRLRDNLSQLNDAYLAREARARIPDGMHKTEQTLDASIVLMEDPSDLIKESDKILEK
jgi:hypothetical protein